MSQTRCRHNKKWSLPMVYCCATVEWCNECGAIRRLGYVSSGEYTPETSWTRPTGIGGGPISELKPLKGKRT